MNNKQRWTDTIKGVKNTISYADGDKGILVQIKVWCK